MLTAVIVSIAVPLVAGTVYLARRHTEPRLAADSRGFALQAAILTVTLIAIAMAVSAVLILRGGEAVDEAERQSITRSPSEFTNHRLCVAYGFSWDATRTDKCYQ